MRKKISFAYIYKQKTSAAYEQLLVQGPVSLASLLQNETFLLLAWWVRSSLWCHLWFAFLGFCWLPCYTNIQFSVFSVSECEKKSFFDIFHSKLFGMFCLLLYYCGTQSFACCLTALYSMPATASLLWLGLHLFFASCFKRGAKWYNLAKEFFLCVFSLLW